MTSCIDWGLHHLSPCVFTGNFVKGPWCLQTAYCGCKYISPDTESIAQSNWRQRLWRCYRGSRMYIDLCSSCVPQPSRISTDRLLCFLNVTYWCSAVACKKKIYIWKKDINTISYIEYNCTHRVFESLIISLNEVAPTPRLYWAVKTVMLMAFDAAVTDGLKML